MKLTKIKDNSLINDDDFLQSALAKKLLNRSLKELEEEGILVYPECVKNTDDLEEDQMIIKKQQKAYYTTNVMGFLGCENERLIVTSRFASGDDDFFLRYMLETVLDYPNFFDLKVHGENDNNGFELLIFLFPYYLKNALRKGLFKTYIRNKYNDMNPKGIIDIARHIKENIPFEGKIAYNQREYSYDNYLIELVRHTIEYIKYKNGGEHILSKVKDEVKLIVSATEKYRLFDRKKIIAENKKHAIRHAYYSEYRFLQALCIRILQGDRQFIGAGKNNVYGILFDGAWLWEEYINTLVKDKFDHPRNKAGESAFWLFKKDALRGKIYPDFVSKDKMIIADAKYKKAENIDNRDYFQVLAYMMRFNAKNGVFFYPESEENEDLRLVLDNGSEDIFVVKHGLKIPQDAENYKEFCEKMKQSEESFKNAI